MWQRGNEWTKYIMLETLNEINKLLILNDVLAKNHFSILIYKRLFVYFYLVFFFSFMNKKYNAHWHEARTSRMKNELRIFY